jgi:seryl-tRNA synthetase
LLAQKAELETKKKELEEAAVAKEVQRDRKIRTIGNYVHESVPVSNDEVWVF